ncbi:acyltransferase family protein [Mucilaginibacter psychrotolerans]|uniref:acyltransferase family protein n=1 Tax=Mucilaginibacter psychrotolerans TaxID=1524096 RepID=UPI00130542CA|nr:acyltransferase [Mucilaginibacter psychrotolerans]
MAYLKQLLHKLSADITAVPAALQQSHYPALDGLRGLAILLLVFGHFGVNDYTRHYGIFFNSATGVNILFVLSGFLITTLLIKEKLRNGSISLKYFYIRRALRILPVAWLFLLVLAGLNHVFELHIRLFDFIAAMLFFKNMPVQQEPYTAHLWPLAVGVQFYLTFPILLVLNIRWYTIISLAIVIVVPVVCVINHFAPAVFASNAVLHLLARICNYMFWKGPVVILIGSVFSLLMFKGIINPEKLKVNQLLSLAILLVGIIVPAKTFLFYTKYLSEYLSAILIGLALVIAISQKDILSKILSSAILTTLGMLSYSIYIWQELFSGTRNLQPWMQYFTQLPLWATIGFKCIFLAVIVSFSFVFEAWFLKLKDKFHYTRSGADKKAAPKN